MIITKQMILSDLNNLLQPSILLDVMTMYHFTNFKSKIQEIISKIENKKFEQIEYEKTKISYKKIGYKPNTTISRIYKFFDELNYNNRYNSILSGIYLSGS